MAIHDNTTYNGTIHDSTINNNSTHSSTTHNNTKGKKQPHLCFSMSIICFTFFPGQDCLGQKLMHPKKTGLYIKKTDEKNIF